jgi:hypothetical protein
MKGTAGAGMMLVQELKAKSRSKNLLSRMNRM